MKINISRTAKVNLTIYAVCIIANLCNAIASPSIESFFIVWLLSLIAYYIFTIDRISYGYYMVYETVISKEEKHEDGSNDVWIDTLIRKVKAKDEQDAIAKFKEDTACLEAAKRNEPYAIRIDHLREAE